MQLKNTIQFIVSFVAALVSGLIAMFFTVMLGLIVPEFVIIPLALLIIGLTTSLFAGWAGTWISPDGRSSQLLSIVGYTEAAAAVLGVIFLIIVNQGGFSTPIIFPMGASVLVLTITASVSTILLRSEERELKRDGKLTLRLVGLAILLSAAVLAAASFFGLLGA